MNLRPGGSHRPVGTAGQAKPAESPWGPAG